MQGNAAPMLALWSFGDEVTYLDPQGQTHKGRQALIDYWEHAAEVNRDMPGAIVATPEHIALYVGDGLLCTLTREHLVIGQGETHTRRVAHATNVFRFE